MRLVDTWAITRHKFTGVAISANDANSLINVNKMAVKLNLY